MEESMESKLKKMCQTDRINFWGNHIKRWQEGKLSQADYCRQYKLSKDYFSRWKRKLEKKEGKESNQFVELMVQTDLQLPGDNFLELMIKDMFKIKISPNQLKAV
jgi:hypothetical protein